MTQFSRPIIRELIVGTLIADELHVIGSSAGYTVPPSVDVSPLDLGSFGYANIELNPGEPGVNALQEPAVLRATWGGLVGDASSFIVRAPDGGAGGGAELVLGGSSPNAATRSRATLGNAGGSDQQLADFDIFSDVVEIHGDTLVLTTPGNDMTVNENGIIHPSMRPTGTVLATNQNVPVSVTYAAFPTEVGHAFTAPPSGAVRVDFHSNVVLELSALGARACFVAVEIRTGSTVGGGVQVYAAVDDDAIGAHVGGASGSRGGTIAGSYVPLTGLTPGNAYHVRLMGRRTATTGLAFANAANNKLLVTPST